jgi:hypothetical protein
MGGRVVEAGGCRGRKRKGERQVGPTGGSWDGGEVIKEDECGRDVYEGENIDD